MRVDNKKITFNILKIIKYLDEGDFEDYLLINLLDNIVHKKFESVTQETSELDNLAKNLLIAGTELKWHP